MKNLVITTIILSGSLGMMSPAGADNIEFDNQNKMAQVSDQQFPDMNKLRGIIDHSIPNPIIGNKPAKKTVSVSEIQLKAQISREVAISLDTRESLIDRVVTGQSNRSMLFQKFDSNGLPMSHHQEYDRPNAKSLASSIWDAIDLNPYPGE